MLKLAERTAKEIKEDEARRKRGRTSKRHRGCESQVENNVKNREMLKAQTLSSGSISDSDLHTVLSLQSIVIDSTGRGSADRS